jgi:DNA-binding transcriptional ArsR family regulator
MMGVADELVWKALADSTRRSILDTLREGPKNTGEICAQFPALTRFGVMKHLKVLQEAKLTVTEEQGREVWHYLNAVPIRQIYERWISPFQEHWAVSLQSLKHKLERKE